MVAKSLIPQDRYRGCKFLTDKYPEQNIDIPSAGKDGKDKDRFARSLVSYITTSRDDGQAFVASGSNSSIATSCQLDLLKVCLS